MGARAENRAAGIFWMLATMFFFILLDTIVKHLLERYSLVEVTWARFFFSAIFSAAICGPRLASLARSATPGVQMLRSVFLMLTTGLFNAGLMNSHLATATTIMYLTPILVTALSVVVLREKVGLRRWLGVMAGLAGALVILKPSALLSGDVNSSVLFFMTAACCNAGYQTATRWVRGDHPLTSLLFTAAAGALVTSCIVPFYWSTPDLTGWLFLVASGLAGGIGHLCLIRALSLAPASTVAPFAYSSLLWAVLFGYGIWGEWPTASDGVGAAIIIAAGLYIYLREQSKARNGATLPPTQSYGT